MSVLERPRWTVDHPTAHRLVREVVLVGLMFGLYNLGRVLAGGDVSVAVTHATGVWDLERTLHLPNEQALQSWVLRSPELVRAANNYYAHVHFPVTFGVLVWLVLRHPDVYNWVRTALILATLAGLVLAFVYPLAPPRMLGELGFIDTGALMGQSVYDSGASGQLANQLAAMPSLHVGWSCLVALAFVAALRSRWRWLALAHPLITVVVVVVTANHYWLDAMVGALLVAAGVMMARRLQESAQPRARRPRSPTGPRPSPSSRCSPRSLPLPRRRAHTRAGGVGRDGRPRRRGATPPRPTSQDHRDDHPH